MDRNSTALASIRAYTMSLSARRAWIEILSRDADGAYLVSLSARRAWIEIPAGCWRDSRRAVALRKESVDRNGISSIPTTGFLGRSPQGERG